MQPPDDWSDWVSATDTYHWSDRNPLIDWLNTFGAAVGFVADSHCPNYDKRFDYDRYMITQSWAFKQAVLRWLLPHSPMRTIATNPNQARDLEKMERTLAAMKEGVPIIAQAVLWNRVDRMLGMVDLLVRSDTLARLMADSFAGEPPEAAAVSAATLGHGAYHYRAIDIKFMTLQLLKDGTASAEHLPSMVQNWIYNQALGQMQGYTPPASYLVGRDFFRAAARVPHFDPQLGRLAGEAAAWMRRLRKDGASWHALPAPSAEELRPNMKSDRDQQWHAAKQEIAAAQHDLTLLPYVGPQRRALAAAEGITRWDNPNLTAQVLGFGDSIEGRRLDAVLLANRSTGNQAVFPERLMTNVGNWQQPARLECFVSVLSVNDQADDFNQLPERGGTAMTCIITWGFLGRTGHWQGGQFVARDLSKSAEADLISAWQLHLNKLAEEQGVPLREVRFVHWGPLPLTFPSLNSFDLLDGLIHKEPITVRGAFTFGLAEMARALHTLRLIETDLPAIPPGVLEAMAGAWSSAREAKRQGVGLEQVDSMQVIGLFSSAACRSMKEILTLLRQRASASMSEAA